MGETIGIHCPDLYFPREKVTHVRCKGYYDYFGEFDCEYETTLDCDDCKYGLGRKDPEAKCNQI